MQEKTLTINDSKRTVALPALAMRGIVMLPGAVMPVSYTHLDVYKRQGMVMEYLENSPVFHANTENGGINGFRFDVVLVNGWYSNPVHYRIYSSPFSSPDSSL